MKQAPQQRSTTEHLTSGEKKVECYLMHICTTQRNLMLKKLLSELNRCVIHYRQSKYFLIVSVHVNEVLHRSNFYRRKKKNTKDTELFLQCI